MKQTRYFIFSILLCMFTLLQAVDYANEIQPIFTANCTGCHGSSGGLNLSEGVSYGNLVNVTSQGYAPSLRVVPGSASTSVLWNKVSGTTGYGSQMPASGCCLDDPTIGLIETWINEGALEEETADIAKGDFLPTKLILNPIYPNPFNPSTTISWEQPGAENIHISIFNQQGQLSDEFPLTKSQPGSHTFDWHPGGLPTGVYLICLTGETFTVTQRAVYLK